MSLIFIYGPPASGKLTIAKELSKETNFKLFHNHLSVDLLKNIFEFGSPEYRELIYEIRLKVIERAIKNNIDLIFTYFYTFPEDNSFIDLLLKTIEPYGVTPFFVQLRCSQDVLLKRVESSDRGNFQKLQDKSILKELLVKYDCATPIPFVKNISIDNTHLSPEQVVKQILIYCGLSP